MDNVSKELCSLYKALQKKIKRFETMCETNHCTVFLNGLNGNGRIKLGLIGEFSSGKTTLVRRIFESYSGKESSVPETACLVVHKQDKFKNLTVKFNQTFTIKNNGLNKFEDFLEKNKLKGYVKKIENDTWESDSDDIPFFSESSEDVKAFFDEVDKYPNVISKIQWCHKKKYESEDCNILDFFEIYDVPGFDGGEEHKETIRQIMETESFDVIICLIETDKGVPTESVINELGEVVDKINNRNPNLIFYWGYEKGNVGKDYDPKASLNYINEAIEKILRKNPFKDAGLLDLTGEISDKERIDNALIKEVLSNYFQKGGECYLESQKSFFG